jgi:hypothetical protein
VTKRRGARRRAVAVSGVAGLLGFLPVASASATLRYAAPGGTAADTVCTSPIALPCSINTAAAGPDVTIGDEAVIAPGNYSASAGDLGPGNYVQITDGVNVHGKSGQPRPVINLDIEPFFGAFLVSGATTQLSHVEIDTSVARTAVFEQGGTVDDVIARQTATVSQTILCYHDGGILRDSACITSGDFAVAVGSGTSGGGTHTDTLRNVSAVASGATAYGISYKYFGVGTSGVVGAKAVIAQGTAVDVQAAGLSSATTTVTLDHSNYDSTDTSLGGGTVTPAATGTGNQTMAPLFSVDHFHELIGSPTIDAGDLDSSSGTTDLDGDARTIGSASDIGADEFNPATQSGSGGGTAGGNVSDTTSPNGKFGKKPKKRTPKRKAKFTFSSSEPGSAFECKLDRKPFRSCSSPFKKAVGLGKHKFQLEATDAAGNADPTPATYKWRVIEG